MTTPESFRKTWRNIATAVAAGAAFLPSFILMLAILPVLHRVRRLTWTRAVLRGMGPAVVGILAVSLFRLAPTRCRISLLSRS